MDNTETESSSYVRIVTWTVLVFIVAIVMLFWVSWRYGMFPFAAESITQSESQSEVVQKDVLDSLTASSSPKERVSKEVLNTLTAKSNGTKTETVPQSVLDSLTASSK